MEQINFTETVLNYERAAEEMRRKRDAMVEETLKLCYEVEARARLVAEENKILKERIAQLEASV